jgi:monovalent cation/proton antiporter MnhG/PhaG subunit
MSARQLAVDVLVVLGVAGELLCCLGLVFARDAFDRLHYASAATTVPSFLLAAAVLVEESFTEPGLSALVVALLLLLVNPALLVATARAARGEKP